MAGLAESPAPRLVASLGGIPWPSSGPRITSPPICSAPPRTSSCPARYAPTGVSFLTFSEAIALSLALRLGTKGSHCLECLC